MGIVLQSPISERPRSPITYSCNAWFEGMSVTSSRLRTIIYDKGVLAFMQRKRAEHFEACGQ
jgi:hypothetical protein